MTGAEDFDEWIFSSLTKYHNLHMYELQQPTRVIEWIDQDRVCVADEFSSSSGRFQLTLLSLPSKLLGQNDAAISKDRDFKIVGGGFNEKPIHSIVKLENGHLATTSPGDTDLSIWVMKNESDVINKTKIIKGERSCSSECPAQQVVCNPVLRNQVAAGGALQDVRVVDVNTEKVVWRLSTLHSDDESTKALLGSLHYIDQNVLLVCSHNGHLQLMDTRLDRNQTAREVNSDISQSEGKACDEGPLRESHLKPKKDIRWIASVRSSGNSDISDALVAKMSSAGDLLISDARNVETPLYREKINEEGKDSERNMILQWAPGLRNHLSVSGFNGCVNIYDLSTFGKQGRKAEPTFTHDGHMMSCDDASTGSEVTVHTWHPTRSNLILSAGCDGSLHAWEWKVS